jgi:hypothetical protein
MEAKAHIIGRRLSRAVYLYTTGFEVHILICRVQRARSRVT